MKYLLTPYTVAQLITGVVAIIVSAHVWQRRETRGGWPLFLLFIAVSEWALANGLESAAVSQNVKIFWSQIGYIGAQVSPPLLLLFVLQYTGKGRHVTPLITAILFLIPAAIIFLAVTNEVHGLIWTNFLPGPPGTNSLIYQHGPAFWVAMVYIFTIVAIANALMIVYSIRSQRIFRRQNWMIILASFIPWAGAIIYVLGLNPFPGLDIVSVSFFFNGLLILLAISSNQLMDLAPVAYELVFANLSDAVIVIDAQMRLVDFNSAARELFSQKNEDDLIGVQITQILDFWSEINDLVGTGNMHQAEINCKDKYFRVRVSPIVDQSKRLIGWAIILDDVSLEKQKELDLEKANRKLQSRIDDINELQDKLQELVVRDSLTGVYNRRYLDETLLREIGHASRSAYPVSLIMMDVDHFKRINDQFGHKMGDDVIAAIGKILQAQTREGDCVSRYGGDEFLLIMPEMTRETAYRRAEIWREGIKAMVFQSGNDVINVSISIGIASFPENGTDVDQLVKAADDALYRAKEQGRDRTILAEI